MCLGAAAPALAEPVLTGAGYLEPTTRYGHAVLGDGVEWGALRLRLREADGGTRDVLLRLPETRVFEDLAPRLVDLGGQRAAMVIETDAAHGARLALYTSEGVLAAGPFIGQPYRWLAPVGAADLDGDGQVEIAWVDRPHLARVLRVWRYVTGNPALQEVASRPGFTNHRIGWDHIAGGLRDCGQGPEMITADGDWQRIMASTLVAGRIETRALGPYDEAAIEAALACR